MQVLAFLLTDYDDCLVAFVDGHLAGFVLGTIVEKKVRYCQLFLHQVWHYGYLTWMGVSSKIQRGGMGRLLFSAFHDIVLKQVNIHGLPPFALSLSFPSYLSLSFSCFSDIRGPT